MKDYSPAINAAMNHGINLRTGNFYADVNHDQACFLAELAKSSGYRKPKNANGSTGRYFFELLKRRFLSTF
jgi:hypothetical protein